MHVGMPGRQTGETRAAGAGGEGSGQEHGLTGRVGCGRRGDGRGGGEAALLLCRGDHAEGFRGEAVTPRRCGWFYPLQPSGTGLQSFCCSDLSFSLEE